MDSSPAISFLSAPFRSTANFFEEWAKNAVPIISRPGALSVAPILQFPIWRAHDRRRRALDASDAADCCPAASAPIARAAGPHEEARADAHTDVGEAAAEAVECVEGGASLRDDANGATSTSSSATLCDGIVSPDCTALDSGWTTSRIPQKNKR